MQMVSMQQQGVPQSVCQLQHFACILVQVAADNGTLLEYSLDYATPSHHADGQ
jgi:hypothetical protein